MKIETWEQWESRRASNRAKRIAGADNEFARLRRETMDALCTATERVVAQQNYAAAKSLGMIVDGENANTH